MRSKDKDEKAYAKQSRDYLRSLVLDKLIIIKCHEFDKYGRLLIYIYQLPDTLPLQSGGDPSGLTCPDCPSYNWENSINCHLVKQGHAYRYDGGKKKKFLEWVTSVKVKPVG